MKDRDTGMVVAEVPGSTDKNTLQGFVAVNTEVDAVVYTDEHRSYQGLPRPALVGEAQREGIRGRSSSYERDRVILG